MDRQERLSIDCGERWSVPLRHCRDSVRRQGRDSLSVDHNRPRRIRRIFPALVRPASATSMLPAAGDVQEAFRHEFLPRSEALDSCPNPVLHCDGHHCHLDLPSPFNNLPSPLRIPLPACSNTLRMLPARSLAETPSNGKKAEKKVDFAKRNPGKLLNINEIGRAHV